MRRRTVVLGGAASAMLAAVPVRAQQPGRQYRLGVLTPLSGLAAEPYLSALREQLAKHGFVEGANLTIDVRYPQDNTRGGGLRAARELVSLRPDAILACTTLLTVSAQAAAQDLPIVFTWVSDPVRSGIVKDFGRPGTNATGVTNRQLDLVAKRVELLRELLPPARRIAVLAGFFDVSLVDSMEVADRAAAQQGLTLARVEARFEWTRALQQAMSDGADAVMIVTPFAMFGLRFIAEEVVQHTMQNRITAMFADIESVDLGGLVAYASNLAQDVRRGADVLARVLRGDSPAGIPVDQAARFELALNLKTARTLGLKIPPSVLVRADRVVE